MESNQSESSAPPKPIFTNPSTILLDRALANIQVLEKKFNAYDHTSIQQAQKKTLID
jgi:hypothetical protein